MPPEVSERGLAEGFVSLGWREMGDHRGLPSEDRAMLGLVAARYPSASPGAHRVWATVLRRFVHEVAPGDRVVHPSKQDRRVNFGLVAGPLEHHPGPGPKALIARRPVRWLAHIPRDDLPEIARNALMAAMTLFAVRPGIGALERPFRDADVANRPPSRGRDVLS